MSDGDRFAVIDIGSNSIRLVVYGGPLRAPTILFNEKVMAGLGVGVQATGSLEKSATTAAMPTLARFQHIAMLMGVERPRTVATAAVRQAANGADFLDQIRHLNLDVELLSGRQEAEAAGQGVIAGIVDADGIVGDLGGGSLELARVRNGELHQLASFPLGVQRIAAIRAKGRKALETYLTKQMAEQKWGTVEKGLPFYLVGGSWRSLAKVHMYLTKYPLPIIHHYAMPPQAATRLVRAIGRIDRSVLKSQNIVAGARIPAMPDAAAMLSALVNTLHPRELIVSATGLREGLLFQGLSPAKRATDPLIIAARAEGARQGRFPEHGDLIDAWIAPLFDNESTDMRRLRHAACLLSDIGWAANPDYRAERGLEAALHGNWTGLTAHGRAIIGQALFASFGGGAPPQILSQLAEPEALAKARLWGLALRLGQRLSGGIAAPLHKTALRVDNGRLVLSLGAGMADLGGEAVERRLKQLASALGLSWSIKTT
jgi:exopolyphosphatase / guanosine-5'-triphosphate,3'-diphosphate pyrophosphatase